MSGLQLIPSPDLSAEETFRALGTNFKLATPVVDYLIKIGIENLEEFRFFWDSEDKIDLWLGKVGLKEEEKNLQGARLRRAWAAVRLWYTQAEQDRSRVATADLDAILQEAELRDVKLAFWVRYRMRFPPDIHPADATLSRVSREMSKRMLCVFSVWKVRSLQYQLHTTNRKRKLADGLFTEEKDDDDGSSQDWESYLDKLHTLMIAYSMAGSAGLSKAPAATSEASLGADSTKFVLVPLDVMLAYFYRAKRTTCTLPVSKRLNWLQARDTEERSEWVSRFRESTLSLGQVAREVYSMRDAHWLPPTSSADPLVPGVTGSPGAAGQAVGGNHFQLGKSIVGRQVAKVLKDGSKLCQAFQHGQCKSKTPCPQGQHRCGLVVKKERVCGASGHGAATCKTSPKSGWGGPGGEGAAPSGVSQPAPVMADLMSGPTAPLTKAFLFCGWQCLPVDWLLDPSHDLSHPLRQPSLAEQLAHVDFICAAMDCSTKSRAREIPRVFDDGRPAPRPLRSVEFPEGLPNLSPSEQSRVDTDNRATSFILDQIQRHAERGGGSVRENPWRSLHWYLPQEQQMMTSGLWQDKRYSSCCLMGARAKSQCLRHNLEEISRWPVLDC